MRHPAGIVGGLLALGAVAAVAANALSFQTGRHPAPLFAKAPPRPEPAGGAAPSTTARAEASRAQGQDTPRAPKEDAPRVPKPDGIGALIQDGDHATASVGPKAVPARQAASTAAKPASGGTAAAKAPPARDGAVKESGKAAPAHAAAPVREARAAEPARAAALHAGAAASGGTPDKAVAFAQRALVKLGYGPLAVDGIAGPSTRAALARFERERRLPGASVARRTLQELEARSGLKPE
jgi:hypothetical protein